MIKYSNNFDLEDRTMKFSQELIVLLKTIQKNNITLPLIDQCLRSGTSIGANYREANGASSRRDFFNKIYICKKEAKETLYWLELLGERGALWSEAKEFVLIFGKIVSKNNV